MPLSGGHDVLYLMFLNAFYALALVMGSLISAHAYHCHMGHTLILSHIDLYQNNIIWYH